MNHHPSCVQIVPPSPLERRTGTLRRRVTVCLRRRFPMLRRLRSQKSPEVRWPLEMRLLRWAGGSDYHCLSDAVRGTLSVGDTGSGKSEFVGYHLATAHVRAKFGIAVFCVKQDEVERWKKLAADAGRARDVLVFDHPDKSELRFNAFQTEISRAGLGAGHTENLVRLFNEVSEITSRPTGGNQSHGGDPFWKLSTDEALGNAVELAVQAAVPLSAELLQQIILTAPKSAEEMKSPEWRGRSLCWKLLMEVQGLPRSARQQHDMEVVADYFLSVWANMASRTRSVVIASVTNVTASLSKGILRELFGGETNVTPDVLADGRILIIGLNLKEYSHIGLMSAALWKGAIWRWAERRDAKANPRPVAVWMDEAQNLVTRTDPFFASTCRSSRIALVMQTQTIGSLQAALGGGDGGKALTEMLAANLVTKVVTCTGDPTTQEICASMVGKAPRMFMSGSSNYQPQDWASRALGVSHEQSVTHGYSQHMEHVIPPATLGKLRTGQKGIVDAVVIRSGHPFSGTGQIFLPVTFRRDF